MSEVNITLYDLLSICFGAPQQAIVNFSALQALLNAVLKQLGLGEVKIRWSDSTPVGVSGSGQDSVTDEGQQQQQQLQRTLSPGTVAELESKLRSQIQSCEDGVSKAMRLIQELHNQRGSVTDEMEELHHQQKMADAAESAAAVEACCHRMDVLEDTVRSLRDTVQKCPDPEELSRCVTWDVLQSALLSEGDTRKELLKLGVVDQVTPTHSPHPVEDSVRTAAATPPVMSGESLMVSGPPQQTHAAAAVSSSSSEGYSETLRSISKLRQRFETLEARVAELGEGKVDQTQLDQLREVVTEQGSGSQDVTNSLMLQLKEQRALMDSLVSDREKLDYCEEMLQILTSQQNETSSEADAGSGGVDSDSNVAHELRQQISLVRRSVHKVEEDVKQLKARQTSYEERLRDQDLQDQLNDLRGRLDNMKRSQTSELEPVQGEVSSEGSVEIERKLSCLFKQYAIMQDTMDNLVQQQTGARAGLQMDRESMELVNDVQTMILQLQAECEKLHETTKCLQDDNRQKQNHMEELFKTTEELEVKKADKQMVKSEIKADKSALEGKVSRVHFDSMTEQLKIMFQELQSRVMDQTQDWHQVKEKLSTDMDCKVLRTELESVKKQLDDCRKSIQEKLQSQGAAEHDDAAAIRKQLVERFHCLCCDRPIVKPTPGPQLMTLPSTPGFPSHKSIRPFTVYTLEQFRQHYRSLRPGNNRYNYELAKACRRRAQLQRNRDMMDSQVETHCDVDNSVDAMRDKLNQNQNQKQNPDQKKPEIQHERIAELADYSHLAASRSCAGSHAVTSSSQRRTGLQHMKHHNQPEVDGVVQSEEVDIVGLDGHIYRGRLNPPAIRPTDTKLPTISTKDVTSSKVKDKSKCSPPHKPAASPELGLSAPVHPPLSAKSAQCSRSASSSSGRDWPVSALGCTSQSSITQASAAAESAMEPQESQQADL